MSMNPMFSIQYGLFVVTACQDGRDNGCITNTVMQVTSQPNRISVTVNKENLTHDMIKETGRFTASIISEKADFGLFKHFGFQSGREVDKFADFADCRRTANGTLVVTRGTNAFISANVVQVVDVGTHSIFIGEVVEMEPLTDVPSATYTYYQEHIASLSAYPAVSQEVTQQFHSPSVLEKLMALTVLAMNPLSPTALSSLAAI